MGIITPNPSNWNPALNVALFTVVFMSLAEWREKNICAL